MSLYFVQEQGEGNPNNHGFQYWQCVDDFLYTAVEDALPPELFRLEGQNGSASECLRTCGEEGFDVAMLRNVEPTPEEHLRCYCLSHRYRFRQTDVSFSCLNYWCPSIIGPCVPLGMSSDPVQVPKVAAVYCRGSTACGTSLLVDADLSGVCEEDEEGTKVADDRVGGGGTTEWLHSQLRLLCDQQLML